MDRILVTGGAGFIGSHVAEELVRAGNQVVVLDDLSGGFVDNLVDGIELVTGSITDVELVNTLFDQKRFDYVFHLAEGTIKLFSPLVITSKRQPHCKGGTHTFLALHSYTTSVQFHDPFHDHQPQAGL